MKNKYIFVFLVIICIFLLVGLYIVDIPSPSTTINEEYNLGTQ